MRDYAEHFGTVDRQIGAAFILNGKIAGLDSFGNPETFEKYFKKLLDSYALDAIEYRNRPGSRPEVGQFLDSVLNAFGKKRIRKGQNNVNIKGKGFLGQALLHDARAVHFSTFPV